MPPPASSSSSFYIVVFISIGVKIAFYKFYTIFMDLRRMSLSLDGDGFGYKLKCCMSIISTSVFKESLIESYPLF